MFLCTRKPLVLSTVWRAAGMTLAAKYEELGDGSGPYPPGKLQRYAIPYSAGAVQEMGTLDQARIIRVLSRNSQLAAQSRGDIWKQEIFLPARKSAQTRPTLVEQIVIFGGWQKWGMLGNLDRGVKEDAIWRPSSRQEWGMVLTDVFGRVGEMIPGGPTGVDALMD